MKAPAMFRIKETDRLLATVQELARLGQSVKHGDDWLAIEPEPLTPATVHCYADHRMAMSFALLGAVSAGVSIEEPACVAKTYPEFLERPRPLLLGRRRARTVVKVEARPRDRRDVPILVRLRRVRVALPAN
jgi:5-enolpyruvylshikimate-3-phosphate synthase